jgi:pimeloyl-ACP methyl ester carboxylesterase
MSTFVLVHGAWHGRWAWDKVVPLLEEAGHKVEAPDLPGLGDDETPVREVSLQSYADRVCQVIDRQSEPVILVGHSMGGIVISQAAEQCPEKIEMLVYLSGFLLPSGTSLVELSQSDTDSIATQNLVVNEAEGVVMVREEAIREAFYGDCSEEDVVWAKARLMPQPLAPLVTPVRTTKENFGRIPRVYIECLRDRGITPSTQRKMYTSLPCERIISMDTSHSPFLSAPKELVSHLVSLASRSLGRHRA